MFDYKFGYTLVFNHDIYNKSLPYEGWLHNCIFCHTITGNEEDYSCDKMKVKLLICKSCYSNKEIEKHQNKLDEWIIKHIKKTRKSCCY